MRNDVPDSEVEPYEILGKIKDLIDLLTPETTDWAKGPRVIHRLATLGFFSGFSRPALFAKITERLETNKDEKEYLATYLSEDLEKSPTQPQSILIESGSTLAYFAKALAAGAASSPLQFSVTTNNFLVQTLLFAFAEVRVTGGTLRKTYLAYLPFNSTLSSGDVTAEVVRDRVAFRRLERQLDALDILYTTASTFGFMIGPLTGTRDNAIFKYCVYNHQAHHRIKFSIAAPKVFCVAEGREGADSGYEWDKEDLNSSHSIPQHLENCFLVFDLMLASGRSEEEVNPKRKAVVPKLAIDGLALQDGHIARRAAISDKRALVTINSAPAELALEHAGIFVEAAPVYGAYSTWLDYLDAQPTGLVELIIGCESRRQAKWLWEVAKDANLQIDALGYRFRYRRRASGTDPILHLVVEH